MDSINTLYVNNISIKTHALKCHIGIIDHIYGVYLNAIYNETP